MIRHIVAFTLSSDDAAQRTADIEEMRARLTALVGVVPGLTKIELGADLGLIEDHWDVVLVSEHDSNEALEGYQKHPAHVEAGAFIRSVTNGRVSVDYEA